MKKGNGAWQELVSIRVLSIDSVYPIFGMEFYRRVMIPPSRPNDRTEREMAGMKCDMVVVTSSNSGSTVTANLARVLWISRRLIPYYCIKATVITSSF